MVCVLKYIIRSNNKRVIKLKGTDKKYSVRTELEPVTSHTLDNKFMISHYSLPVVGNIFERRTTIGFQVAGFI